jgi:hypothetical protein
MEQEDIAASCEALGLPDPAPQIVAEEVGRTRAAGSKDSRALHARRISTAVLLPPRVFPAIAICGRYGRLDVLAARRWSSGWRRWATRPRRPSVARTSPRPGAAPRQPRLSFGSVQWH